ncbi:AsmA-like C-terminal region-containing protein [Pseudohoeflea coraliihabitans]|uniref:AsmA family protein n=1 Tax=Pseudohoeflea coraliihabitans TaxID=2860393 RepID=A0ABS6WMY9_9HYPH|nr:AsmA-like C-terminal region-containing protein [Pseudohoeflea sp. DP4N28-3]MBW3097322.1 hypothetical protein [Pseudohoeflea sp. DP4N28-3]
MLRRWRFGRSIFAIAGLAAAGTALVLLLLAFAVSSDVMRDKLERDIGNWAGHRVALGDAPKLSFWPVPTIQLDKVSILPLNNGDSDPVMRADSIIADFNLFSAALGTPSYSEFRLIRPTFNLEIYPDGSSNWTSRQGALSRGIAAAVERQAAENGEQSADSAITIPESAAIGAVTLVDGTLNWTRDPGAPTERISAINGTISWPSPTASARANLDAIFRGEQLHIEGVASAPLLILGQRIAPLELSISSAPLNLTFDGEINTAPEAFADGTLTLESPSVRRTLEWSGTEIKPGEAIGALQLSAEVTTSENVTKLDDLIVVIDENRGIGVLDVTLDEEAPPVIAGTLAFNSLDITSFLAAFTPLPHSGAEIASTIDTRFLRELGLDLRLSAQSARFGPISMTNLAAAARVDSGRATFDLGDATAYGGSLIGRIAISEAGTNGGGTLQVTARDVDIGALLEAGGLSGPLPRGRGTLDLQLHTPYPAWATTSTDMTGHFSMFVQDGAIADLSLATLRELAESRPYFRLDELADGSSFAFHTARFAARIANGQAEITEARIVGEDELIQLSGIVPYTRGSLAVSGTLASATSTPADTADGTLSEAPAADSVDISASEGTTGGDSDEAPPLRFFLGGSWPEPVISPFFNDRRPSAAQ